MLSRFIIFLILRFFIVYEEKGYFSYAIIPISKIFFWFCKSGIAHSVCLKALLLIVFIPLLFRLVQLISLLLLFWMVFSLKSLTPNNVPKLATCALKPKVPGSDPAARYVQRWALCSNRPADVWVSVKQVEVIEGNQRDSLTLLLMSCESWMFVKENPGRKKMIW